MARTSGIRERHSRRCNRTKTGGRCNCEPAYEAWVWIGQDQEKRRKTFSGKGAKSAAKNWHTDAAKAVKDGKLRVATKDTLQQAVDEFLAGAEAGTILNKRKEPYKPSVVRQYRSALNKHVLPTLGQRRLDSITFAELERLQEQLQADHSGGTVRNAFVPLKTIFRRARRAGVIAVKPTDDLELPTAAVVDRSATPAQAAAAIEAAPEDDQALWATAFYAGLRRGELRALRVENIGPDYIEIEHGWDDVAGEQAPKSKAGVRMVPMTEALRPYLDAHIERTGRTGSDLAFGRTAREPFTPHHVSDRADEAWAAAAVGAFLRGSGGVERFTLKDARASFRTWLDAAGVSDTRADRYQGHSTEGHVRGRYITKAKLEQMKADAARLDEYLSGETAGKVVTLDVRKTA